MNVRMCTSPNGEPPLPGLHSRKSCRRLSSACVALVAAILFHGCRGAAVPRHDTAPESGAVSAPAVLFQTDSAAYTLRAGEVGYQGRIGVRFTNRTEGAAYVVNCNGSTAVSLEKLVDGQWRAVWFPALAGCLDRPIIVPPRGTHDLIIDVFGGYADGNAFPRFAVADVAGVYRAVWDDVLRSYQDRLPFGDPLPLEQRLSNQFTLTVQSRKEDRVARPFETQPRFQ